MNIKLMTAVIASSALFAGSALAQQSNDPGMQQSGQSADQQQMMQQKGAMMQDPQTVKQVQQALSNQGYYSGPVDGKWGSNTQDSVRKFQQAQGMQPTGQLDQQTLASLGISGSAGGGQQGGMPGQQGGAGGQGGMSDQQSGAGGQQGGSKY